MIGWYTRPFLVGGHRPSCLAEVPLLSRNYILLLSLWVLIMIFLTQVLVDFEYAWKNCPFYAEPM